MPPQSFTPQLRELLRAGGCTFHRQGKGDHEIWYGPVTKRYVTVDGKCTSRHTANGALKEAGLPKAF
jgi:hypothetical protein